MGMIRSILSAFRFDGNRAKKFKPAADAVITEMHIFHAGMSRASHYNFSLRADGEKAIFNADYRTGESGKMAIHEYEDVSVNPSYLDELRKLAAEKNLIVRMKKYRKPKIKYMPLDGDMKNTSIVMSDGTEKNAEILFDSEFYEFFISVAKAYAEFDRGARQPEISNE